MTWGEIKLLTLQKMFAVTGDVAVVDDTTRTYIAGMPGAANEGLQLLATAGRFIKKTMTIEQDGTDDETQRYDLKRLRKDFYSLDERQIFRIDEKGIITRTEDFALEGESVLVLEAGASGEWLIYYNAYPQEITKETPDETVIALHPEAAVLLPLYMASQLYKDDDIGQSVQYRNEFEVGREILQMNAARMGHQKESFVSVTGWC